MPFDKNAHITALIAAGNITEATKGTFETMDEAVLALIVPNKPAAPVLGNADKTPAPAPEKQMTPQDFDAWMKLAPKSVQTVVNAGLESLQVETSALITKITGAANNKFTEEQLKTFDLPILRNMAALVPAAPAAQSDELVYNGQQPFYGLFNNAPVTNKAGTDASGAPKEILEAPAL